VFRAFSTLILSAVAGCAASRPAATPPPPEPVFFVLTIPAAVDSAVSLARFALREINGALQAPRFANGVTSVTTHYVRTRQDGGETRVAVVVEVSHKIVEPSMQLTAARLSAWALDYGSDFINRQAPAPSARRAPPLSASASSLNAPLNSRPRAITEADDYDLAEMLHVLDALVKLGARRQP
jgi:hypothetical protein